MITLTLTLSLTLTVTFTLILTLTLTLTLTLFLMTFSRTPGVIVCFTYSFLPSRQVLLYVPPPSPPGAFSVRTRGVHHRPRRITDVRTERTSTFLYFICLFIFHFFDFFVVSCVYLIILFFNTFFIFIFSFFIFHFFIFHFSPAISAVPTRRLTQGARCSIA